MNVEPLKPEETPRKGGNSLKYDFRQASKVLNLKAPPLLQPLKFVSPFLIPIRCSSARNLRRGRQSSHNDNASDSNNEESDNEEVSESLKSELESSECSSDESNNDSDDDSDIII